MDPSRNERRPLHLAGLLGAAVTAFEIAVDAALLRVFLALSPEAVAAAVLGMGPVLALSLLWWVLFPRRWLRPLRLWLDRRASGAPEDPAGLEEAREALVRFTRRTLFHRTFAMLGISLVLGPTVAAATDLGSGAAATIVGVTTVAAFWFNTLRAFLYRRSLAPLHETLFAGVDPHRVWARGVRERLFTGPYLLGGVGVVFIGIYTYLVLDAPEAVIAAFLFVPPIVGALGLLWGVILFRATAPVLRYMGRDKQDPAGSLRAALALPHVLGLTALGHWAATAVALTTRQLLRGYLPSQALQVGAGIVAVGAVGVVFQVIWHRKILEPAVEASAAALGDAFVPRRGPLGLYGRLVYGPLALVVFGGTFAAMTAYQEHEQVLAREAERVAEFDLAKLHRELSRAPSGLPRDPCPALLAPPGVIFFVSTARGELRCSTEPVELPPAAQDALRGRDLGELSLQSPRAALAWRTLPTGELLGVVRPFRILEHTGMKGTAALLFVFTTLVLVSLGLVWLVAHDVATPLRRLAGAARRIGGGDLRTPVPIGGDDEVGQLGHSVEQMRKELSWKLAELEELNRSLEARVKTRTVDLEDANRQLSSALLALGEAQDRIVGQEKMASIGRLVAGIAHEINNPLNFVANGLPPIRQSVEDLRVILAGIDRCKGLTGPALEAAVAGVLAEKQRREIEDLGDADQLLQLMQRGVSRMAAIVRSLRDFSRIDRPDEPARLFDLARLLEDSLALLRHELEGRVEVVRDEFTESSLVGREGPLGQVLVNLIKNAAHAAARPGGGGRIRLATRRVDEGLEIDVEDNGPGIAPEVLSKIFEPFFTTKAVGEGTGLGLSIAHGIVEREGGRIRVRTVPGEGTCFTIVLPERRLES